MQGINDGITAYFYDLMDLFPVVEPAMSEVAKLDYLSRGLKPTLLAKFYSLCPRTTAKCFIQGKNHSDTVTLAHRRDWAIAALSEGTNQGVTEADPPLPMLALGEKDSLVPRGAN